MTAFLDTARRARLFRVVLVYLGASFAVLEAVDLLGDKLVLPEWVFSGAVVLLLVGLPIVIATAVIQSAPREAVAEAPGARPSTPTRMRTSSGLRSWLTWRNALLGGVLAFAVWGVLVTGWLLLTGPDGAAVASSPFDRQKLVVLPFENLSDERDDYFAEGLTDAITARLASLPGLAVISRQSAVQYRQSDKTAQEIGEELSVGYILEGTVQRERPSDPSSRVRVSPQLIRISDDSHLWAATYDEEGTEVFRVQSEIAERVAQALDLALLGPREGITKSPEEPTSNLEAYDYYLRGNDYFNRGQLGYLELAPVTAVEMYQEAVRLDPEFGEAWAALSRAHTLVYDNDYDISAQRLLDAKAAAEQALELDPNLPEAHLALGSYYAVRFEYDRAIDHLDQARELRPDDAEILTAIGEVNAGRGRWDVAIVSYRRAAELDPRSASTVAGLATTLASGGQLSEAERHMDRAIAIAPDQIIPYIAKLDFYLFGRGDVEGARRLIEAGGARMGSIAFAANMLSSGYAYFRLLGDDYAQVLDRLSVGSFGHDTVSHFFYYLATGEQAERLGRAAEARARFDSARVILEGVLSRAPAESFWLTSLARAHLGLGQGEAARRAAEAAVELVPPEKDVDRGASNVRVLAEVHVVLGNHDTAVELLSSLQGLSRYDGPERLRIDPVWDPLEGHPGFQRLLKGMD